MARQGFDYRREDRKIMKEKIARAAAVLAALLLTAAYFGLPSVRHEFHQNNSGRKKLDLENGEVYSWTWAPEMEGTNFIALKLSGMKKAQDVILHAEVLDPEGQAVSFVTQAIAELGEDGDSIRLSGSFEKKKTYTLRVWTEGQGSLKLKGEEDDETEAFYPFLGESASFETRNTVLLYFAFGALMIALTPVSGNPGRKRETGRAPAGKGTEQKESGGKQAEAGTGKKFTATALPWAAFLLVAALGILILSVKPMFVHGEPWASWDEDIHWSCVQSMSLFRENAAGYLAANLITWNPGYVPLALGYNIGHLFTANEDALYHVAVSFGAFTYAVLIALAVKHTPRYRATFLAAGTLPVLIFQMTSTSYDTVVAGSILLGIALVLESAESEKRITPLRAMTMVSLLCFGTVAKPAYSLALLALMMIPADRFGGRGRAWLFRGFSLVMLAWCAAAMVLPGAYEAVASGDGSFAGTSVSGQTAYMLANPIEGGLKPVRYVFGHPELLMKEGISHWAYLGNNHQLNSIYLWLLLAAAPAGTLGEDRNRRSLLTPGRRIALGCIALVVEIILAYGQYLASSEVGGELVGMQGRYFMPVWIALALALMWPHGIRKRLGRLGDVMTVLVWLICFGTNLWNAMDYIRASGLM